MKIKSKFLLTIVFLAVVVLTKAQVTTSSISGMIKDKEGPLVGATIKAVYQKTGMMYGVITTDKGNYVLNNLAPGGPYLIEVSFIGYEAQKKENVYLTLGVDETFSFTLKSSDVQLSEVVVTTFKGGTAAQAAAKTNISKEQIDYMPTLSRSFKDMVRLTPQGSNNSFMGTNFRYNNVTIDGAINNDAIGFSPSLGGQTNSSGMIGSSTRSNAVSLDAIQEMQVFLSPFDIKIGNFLGGSINAVTRSGSNKVEGSVYGFGRNSALVGPNSAGDKSAMPSGFTDYQTGYRVGLPLIKDKLFFFSNMELARRDDPIIFGAGSSDISNVITAQQATDITNFVKTTYGFDPMQSGTSSRYANSEKFFNRLDWNINAKNQLILRNNTVFSRATNLERDQQNFRFQSNDFLQKNNSTSTVLELKSRLSNSLSNNLVLGYSSVKDTRDPLADPRMPQIQIASGGGTIFLGSERESTIFGFKQNTLEISDNLTFFKNSHTFTIGTHNELYNIDYGFVNSWNGRLDYNSVADFLAMRPARVRGNYNYTDNTRSYILAHPSASFHVNLYSVYGQDEIKFNRKFSVTAGIRFDLAQLPTKPTLSTKTSSAVADVPYGTTYAYTQPKDIKNEIFGKVQFSPRIGFNYDVNGNRSLVVRGGTGLFTGRIPFAWLGYAFYNNGDSYGSYDQKYTYNTSGVSTPAFVGDPSKPADTGIGYFASQNGVNVKDASSRTQVDMIDNNFKMPQVWRTSLALDITKKGWKFTLEGIYTQVINDLKFQHVNLSDNAIYYPYDVNKQQPIYVNNTLTSSTRISNNFTNAYLLSNTDQGYRYSVTGQVTKAFDKGFRLMAAYTYGQSKDITNGIRNSMESNWQLNQALNPNSPGLAYSNFDVRHRIIANFSQQVDWNKTGKYMANFSLFFNAQSGTPFSYGFLNATVQNTAQQVSLAYIPKTGETSNFFVDGTLNGVAATAQQISDAYDKFIDANSYLKGRRGNFTERNGGRTPWNVSVDFRFNQDFKLNKTHTLSFIYDIVNLTNLINSSWGKSYFSPNSFNSTSSIGLRAPKTAGSATAYPKFNSFSDPGVPYAVDLFASRFQMQFGIRYSF